MKTEKTIKKKLNNLIILLGKKEKEYSSLDQIGALDSSGVNLYEKIQNIKSQIDALKWVLL